MDINTLKIIIDQNDSHVHFRIFFNGGLCGSLTMRQYEYNLFRAILVRGYRAIRKENDKKPLKLIFEESI